MDRLVQLALDFFGLGPPADDPGAMAPPRRPVPSRLPRPRISRPRLPDADDLAPVALLAEADGTLPQHPRANREVLLDTRRVAYEFLRGKRRTIGFSVSHEGLAVRAPSWVPLHEVDDALVAKAAWILRKLAEAGAVHEKRVQNRIAWADGVQFPLLGRPVTVRLVRPAGAAAGRGARAVLWTPPETVAGDGAADDAPAVEDAAATAELRLPLPVDAAPVTIAAAVRSWMLSEARQHFVRRLEHFAPRLRVRFTRLSLTSARTRWGSASSDGSIRLHWRLMHFRPEVVDYVVVHELAHLRHMDHSPRFWAVVATEVPDHPAMRRELRQDSAPRW